MENKGTDIDFIVWYFACSVTLKFKTNYEYRQRKVYKLVYRASGPCVLLA